MGKYKLAVVQMDTQAEKAENLQKMKTYIEQAVEQGAQLVCFPEMVNIQSPALSHLERSEMIGGKTTIFISQLAKKYGIWICLGTILEEIEGEEKVFNTSILFGRDGKIKATYRKRHTFDISMADGREYRESDTVKPGQEKVLLDTDLGKIGFGICYDLRFPEQFREMSLEGMKVLLLPASFTKETGMAHWDTLVRARAIENGCYVLACNQCGQKMEYEAYGHSMIIDPWGNILAKAEYQEELLVAEIDLDYVDQIRMQIPSTISI